MSEPSDKADAERPQATMGRRRFLAAIGLGAGALGAAAVTVPVVGYVLGPVARKVPRQWRSVGVLDKFPVGKTVAVSFENASPQPWAGVTARSGAWVRRTSDTELVAFALNCTHLGCPVRWEEKAEMFMCPCHGGVYYANGDVAAGPPPLPLRRYTARIQQGQVQILTQPLAIT